MSYFQGEDIVITLTPNPADTNLSDATEAKIRIHWQDDDTTEELTAVVSTDAFVATLEDTKTALHSGTVTVQGYAVYGDGTKHYSDSVSFELLVPITV